MMERGAQVIGIQNFNGVKKTDLTFKKGDVLTIVESHKEPGWFLARDSNCREGLIPAMHVQLKVNEMPWLHGRITREEAEKLLAPLPDGAFLIRESTNFPGDFTLCVAFKRDGVQHYHILQHSQGFTVDEECFFLSLVKLVEHYQADANGIVFRLTKAVHVKPGGVPAGYRLIPYHELHINEVIGQGEFGEVRKGTYKSYQVAIKSLKTANRDALERFQQEADLMKDLTHQNLVRLFGICGHDGQLLILTEYMRKGSLLDYLQSRGRSVITNKDLVKFAKDVAEGMAYLVMRKIVHRDLAARNILVSDEDVAKVSDFGLAIYGNKSTEKAKIAVKWTAPEVLEKGATMASSKSDVWSFGILLWEEFSFGRVPYPRIPVDDVPKVVRNGYQMDSPEGCPPEIYALMQLAWNLDPEKRLSFKEMVDRLDKVSQRL